MNNECLGRLKAQADCGAGAVQLREDTDVDAQTGSADIDLDALTGLDRWTAEADDVDLIDDITSPFRGRKRLPLRVEIPQLDLSAVSSPSLQMEFEPSVRRYTQLEGLAVEESIAAFQGVSDVLDDLENLLKRRQALNNSSPGNLASDPYFDSIVLTNDSSLATRAAAEEPASIDGRPPELGLHSTIAEIRKPSRPDQETWNPDVDLGSLGAAAPAADIGGDVGIVWPFWCFCAPRPGQASLSALEVEHVTEEAVRPEHNERLPKPA